VLIVLIVNMLERNILLKTHEELTFIQRKQDKLTYAVFLGCLVSIFVIIAIILVLTQTVETLSNNLVAILKVAIQILTFALLIGWSTFKYYRSLPIIKEYVQSLIAKWNTHYSKLNNALPKRRTKKQIWQVRTKLTIYWIWLLMLFVWYHIKKSFFFMSGLYIYLIYAFVIFFGLQIGIWPFAAFLVLFMIYVLRFVAEYTLLQTRNLTRS
jgi:hypothetical protein